MRGQVSAPSSLPRGERGCSSLFPSMAVRAGRTGLRPAGTSGRTVRSGPALDGRGPAGPDRTSGPVRVRPDASGVRSFPRTYIEFNIFIRRSCRVLSVIIG